MVKDLLKSPALVIGCAIILIIKFLVYNWALWKTVIILKNLILSHYDPGFIDVLFLVYPFALVRLVDRGIKSLIEMKEEGVF